MAKQMQKVSFTFINPNRADAVARALRRLLIEKLASRRRQTQIPAG